MRAKKKKKRIIRITVFITAVSLLAVLLTSLDLKDMSVDAASLKHIDEIVASSGTFNILEIVPDTTGASIGYYIDGQEPIKYWKEQLSVLMSPADRSDYVNTLFSRLADKGVLGEEDVTTTPLQCTYYDSTNSSYYTETYEVSDETGWNVLELDEQESTIKTGTFTQAEDGPYHAEYEYTLAVDGGYVQNISYFSYTDAPDYDSGAYYYNPTFTVITPETDLAAIPDTVVYFYDDETEVYYTTLDADNDPLTVQAIIDQGGFDISSEYFYVDPTQTGEPGTYNYEAVVSMTDVDDAPGDGFIAMAEGPSYFTRDIISFTYDISLGGGYVYFPEGSEEWTVNYPKVYYKAGFENNNLFKKQVFDLDDASLNVLDITVNTKIASAVTVSDVNAADLIYLSVGTDITQSGANTVYTDSNDISDAIAIDVYSFGASRYPVIIDYAIIDGINQWTPEADINNMEKLSLLLLQSDLAETEEASLSALIYDWDLLLYMYNDLDRTFVNNSVYCFNAFNTESTSSPADITALETELFAEPFSSQVYSDGFSDVLAEIENENFLREIAGETERLSETVSVATSVRHIINFRGRRENSKKTHITVLDLEPAKVTEATWLTAETVSDWIDGSLDADKITIVHMTTGEFNGKIEDINETYDMIYIGMSTESLNTSGGSTVYNDASMNGLIYSNIGDTYYATIEMAGIREQDYVWVDGVKAINGTEDTNANLFRFSGNDITDTKVSELKKFAQAGYPIILADGFVSGGGINTAHVDNSSYMYEAVSSVYGVYGNVMARAYADSLSNSDEVIQYLNVSKPSLDILTKPIDYETQTGSTLTPDSDGYYYLQYSFSIGNVTDPTPISTTYDCRLYIDINADGRFADSEELGDIIVYREDGSQVLPLSDGNGGETYALSADITYRISRQMPTEYVGIIPWKLEVIKNGAAQIHASAEGYTRIAAGVDSKEEVKVLQIMQSGTSTTKLNLSLQLDNNGIYGQLINNLQDFDIDIDAIENDELEAIGSSDAILDYLDEYDMLIIGFNDCYNGIGENGAAAITSYIGLGKSVLFTHDTTSLSQVPYYNYPMATQGDPPRSIELDDTDVVWNAVTSEYASINGNINWYGEYSTTCPPYLKQNNPTYVVFLDYAVDSSDENDYFSARAGDSGDYAIYQINNIYSYNSVYGAQQTNVYSSTSLTAFKNAHPGTIVYVYSGPGDVSGWYRPGQNNRYSVTATCDFTKFVGGVRYECTDLTYYTASGRRPNNAVTIDSTSYDWLVYCLGVDNIPDNYEVVGTYDGSTYWINWTEYFPPDGAAFPSRVLYDREPSDQYELDVIPNSITDWGYYFNTIIRDAVGLDRYGVTSTMLTQSGELLKDIVDTSESMSYEDIDAVLACNRSVAFAPNSGCSATVDEFQGYTNYALIRFAESNNYRYTNNTYSTRETTNVSQVNKGQITTYPYNVNTEDFSATDDYIGSGDSYMTIGKTHEQYFQINMNTDDIVVWYCLSSGGTDNNSYYDDVPNDCVNAYYIYNKGNVTYSGVGHSSNASLYGSDASQEYVNEAMLFVNTMIAAYQSGEQSPTVSIKQDERGTADLTEKYMPVDESDSVVLQSVLDENDEGRIVYFRVSDPNIGVDKEITLSYYVSDENSETIMMGENVSQLELTTHYTDDTIAETIRGGYMYMVYLPNSCFEKLAASDVYSIQFYVMVTTKIGDSVLTAYDSLELKKLQLFELS